MNKLVCNFGVLRMMLMLITVLLIAGGVIAATVDEHFDWDRMPVALVPAFMPIVFTVILFDMVMSKLRMSDTTDIEEQSRFRQINTWYRVLLGALVLSWVPFVLSIVKGQL